MTALARIEAPLVNPNEPEAVVTELGVEAFGRVAAGAFVATLETSKATVDVESPAAGFLGPLAVGVGDRVTAGTLLCEVFAERPDPAAAAAVPAVGGRTVTKKAAALAASLGVDAETLPGTGFVTEAEVRAAAPPPAAASPAAGTSAATSPSSSAGELQASQRGQGPTHATGARRFGAGTLVLFGGGGLARTIVDLVRAAGELEVAGVLDDGVPGLDGILHLGGAGELDALAAAAGQLATGASPPAGRGPLVVNAVGAIGRPHVRQAISARLAASGLTLATLVDPSASVAASATLVPGALVFAQAVVSAAAVIEAGAIVNSGAIVSHDCRVGPDAHVAPGAILAGEVTVGAGALVGMAVTVPVGVSVGAGSIVGNGATVLADVPAGARVPAGEVWRG